MEKGNRGVFSGSKPHSYMDIFSASGWLFLVSIDIVKRIIENLILMINKMIIGINSSCFMV